MTYEVHVTQADREAAAKALGYRDWSDATDYRLTGEQDRKVREMVLHMAAHRTIGQAKLVEALAPFARVGNITLLVQRRDENGEHWISTGSYAALNISDFRHARDVYQALAAHPRPHSRRN